MKVESTNVILVKLSAPNNNQNGTKNTLNFGSDGIICTSQSYSSEFSALKEFVCGFSHGSANLLTSPLEFPKKETRSKNTLQQIALLVKLPMLCRSYSEAFTSDFFVFFLYFFAFSERFLLTSV